MARDARDTTWELKGQTSAKHEILRQYLGAWFPIMATQQGRIIFIDGFAGPGVYDGGEAGSPIIALESLLNHRNVPSNCQCIFLFNEEREDRALRLREVLQDHERVRGGYPSNIVWEVHNRPFEDLVDEILAGVGNRSLAPTLAFVDPFGFSGASMSQLQRLLAYDRCELLIYFDYNNINRFATSPKANVEDTLAEAFGTRDFAAAPPRGTPARREFLLDLYARQLSEVAGFPYVQHFRMDNHANRTVYYLFYATRHTVGLDRMKAAMWKVAPTGDYRFMDSLAGQDVLIGLEEVDLTPLKNALLQEFGGRTVHVDEVEHFVITQTPYFSGHLKRKTLSPMQRDGVISTNITRRGSFKDALITFTTP